MQLSPESTRDGYSSLWQKMQIRPEKKAFLDDQAQRVAAGMAQYEEVERETGVPWWFVGIVHLRESNLDFKTFLGNGEPLDRVTRLVPKGLGPWKSWKDGAVEALRRECLDKVKTWDIPTALYFFEKFNGFGYVSKGINSPYVWAGSNLYSRGKFTADSKFSALFIDPQPGCAPMLQILIATGLIPNLVKEVINMAGNAFTTDTVAPVTVPTKNTSTGVTINKGQNLATHAIAAVGAILATSGFVQAHSIWEALMSAPFLGGLIVSGLAMAISHFNVNGANDNTIDLVDKVLVALTPQQSTPSANPPQAA